MPRPHNRWVGPDWSVTFWVGERDTFAITYPHLPEEVESGRVYLWQVPGLVRKQIREGDLVVCELNKILRLSPGRMDLSFTVPQFIQQVIDQFDRPLDEIMAEFQPHIRKRIRRQRTRLHFELHFESFDFLPRVPTWRTPRRGAVMAATTTSKLLQRGVRTPVKRPRADRCRGGCSELRWAGRCKWGLWMAILSWSSRV
jgi:hypothetical protein